MNTPETLRLGNILLADDGSADARAAVDLLASLPSISDSAITALRIFSPLQTSDYQAMADGLQRTKNLLMSRHLRVQTELVLGYPSSTLLGYAEEHQPDMIVMGARGQRSAPGISLGGVSMHLVEDGRWPVLLVRKEHAQLKRVLLVVDGSESSTVARDYLARFPLPEKTKISVMHVMSNIYMDVMLEPFAGGIGISSSVIMSEDIKRQHEQQEAQAKRLLNESISDLKQRGLSAKPVLLRGDAAAEIMHYVTDNAIDLIVAGSRGLGAVRSWLMGSVSRKLVHYADCCVLIVRNPNEERN